MTDQHAHQHTDQHAMASERAPVAERAPDVARDELSPEETLAFPEVGNGGFLPHQLSPDETDAT